MTCVTYTRTLAAGKPAGAGRLKMPCKTYLDTGPPRPRKKPGVGSSWREDKKMKLSISTLGTK